MNFPQITHERLKELRESVKLLKRDTRTGALHYMEEANVNPWKTDIIRNGELGARANDVAQFNVIEIGLYLPFHGAAVATIAETYAWLDQCLQSRPSVMTRYLTAMELWLHQHPRPDRFEAWLILYKSTG